MRAHNGLECVAAMDKFIEYKQAPTLLTIKNEGRDSGRTRLRSSIEFEPAQQYELDKAVDDR